MASTSASANLVRRFTALDVTHLPAAGALCILAGVLPLVLSSFEIGLVALWLPFVMLAISVDLLWGENRIVSFGHGAFFAGGGYIAGLLLKGPAADTTGTNYEILGDASTSSTFDTVVETLAAPKVVGIPVLALLLPPLVCGLAGWLVGFAIFRTGSVEIYAPLITLGIGVIATTVYLKTPQIGGSNGLSGIPSYTREISSNTNVADYAFNLAWVALVCVIYWAFRSSRSGRKWRASGDDPIRLEALGTPVRAIRAAGFAASTALAGLAGAIYVGTAGFMSADLAGVLFSVQALIWVAVGGPGFLLAPLVGVMAVQLGERYLSERLQDSWQLFLGVLFIAVVLIAPKGLTGLGTTARDSLDRIRRTRTAQNRSRAARG